MRFDNSDLSHLSDEQTNRLDDGEKIRKKQFSPINTLYNKRLFPDTN